MNLRSKIFKFLLGIVVGLAICLLVTFNALLVWVATAPRSLSALTPYIESSLKEENFSVNIGDTMLIWDGWRHPIDMRLKDVAVITSEGELFSRFPEISLGVDLFSLPFGRIVPTSLNISKANINLIQHEDRSLSIGFKQESEGEKTEQVPVTQALGLMLAQDKSNNFRKLDEVIIRDVTVSVSNASGLFFTADSGNLALRRNDAGQVNVSGNAILNYADYHSKIGAEFTLSKGESSVNGVVEFGEVMPNILGGLFFSDPNISSFAVPLSGKAVLSVAMDGTLQNAGFELYGSKGEITSAHLDGKLPITSFSAKGLVSNQLNDIKIDELKAEIDGAQLHVTGTANIADNDPEVHAILSLSHVAGDKARMFWPPALAPMSREWVVSNISKGTVPLASVKLDINKGDTLKDFLPKEAVDANIQLESMQVKYLPGHPALTNVKGNIHVDGVTLDAAVASADYLTETKLNNGRVLIEDLRPDNPYINVSFNADAPARDIVHLLGLPKLQHAARLNLREGDINGNVKGEAKLGFYFEDDASNIAFDIKGDISDVSQTGFMNKFDLEGVTGQVAVNKKGVEFAGRGKVNGATASQAKVSYLFKPEKGFDSFIDVAAVTPVENLKRFGYPDFSFLQGSLGVKATVQTGDDAELSEATIDLTNAAVNYAEIGWSKPDKEPATFTIKAEKKNGAVQIPSFTLKGKDMDAAGNAILAKDLSGFAKLELSNYSNGPNKLESALYDTTGDRKILKAKGASIDLTHYLASDSSELSFARFPATELTVDVGKVTLGKDRVVTQLVGNLNCSATLCESANFTGMVGEQKKFSAKILRNPKGTRQLAINADDAGAFLKTMSVFDSMEGGELTLNGDYAESNKGSTLSARLRIGEHTIKDAPVLARILSLASFTGFIDTLEGNGIRFTKLSIPFTLHNDVAKLEEGKTYGPAIGMTVEGTITFPKKTLDLNGTVVPSYTLNTVLDKVPVLGEILTGGKGEGMFAARYTITGADNDKEVHVNPLSILTPGFLRGLFDVFEGDKEKPADSAD